MRSSLLQSSYVVAWSTPCVPLRVQVVWGHEHECLVEAQQSTEQPFHITQPGSTVPTSLIEERAPARPRTVGIQRRAVYTAKRASYSRSPCTHTCDRGSRGRVPHSVRRGEAEARGAPGNQGGVAQAEAAGA